MRCHSPEAVNNFSFFVSQTKSEYVEQQKMTLEKKLSVIKRCIAEIEFSKTIENELNILSIYVKKYNDVLTSDELPLSFLKSNNKSKSSIHNSLSLFAESENKISVKENSKHSKRKNSILINKLIGSLLISSTDNELMKIHFRLK